MAELLQVTRLLSDLFLSQRLAVLSTQDGGQPYRSLVAFAETDDLKQLLFVTNRNTRKYKNLEADKRAIMLIDSHTNQLSDFLLTVAVMAIGIAEEVLKNNRDVISSVFLRKHSHLVDFVNRPDNALISLTVSDYAIANFGEVNTIHVEE